MKVITLHIQKVAFFLFCFTHFLFVTSINIRSTFVSVPTCRCEEAGGEGGLGGGQRGHHQPGKEVIDTPDKFSLAGQHWSNFPCFVMFFVFLNFPAVSV